MNEDEAFIRAIVDNPGDDTARLVYADWLDERDDSRGTYLRAEFEAIKSGDIAQLRQLSLDLDSVWLARISRPPLGVCCDHMRLESAQPAVGNAELNAMEYRLKLSLPVQLRAMLLNYNGGKPQPKGYRAQWRKPDDSPDYIAEFFSVIAHSSEQETTRSRHPKVTSGLEYATKVLNNGFVSRASDADAHGQWNSGVRNFVAFAEPLGIIGVLAIGLKGKRADKVYEFNRTLIASSSPPKLLADSLSQFLASITFTLNQS